jgi:DNA polymerase III delta prime subunit
MKLADYKPHAARHIMLYGPPKVGKTIAVLQLAKYGFKLHILDGEDSIKSAWAVDAEGKRIIPDEAFENINLIKLPDSMTHPIMGETVLKIIKGGLCKICHLHGKVSCPICSKNPDAIINEIDVNTFGAKDILVLETATQLGNSFIAHIKQKEIKADTQVMDLKLDFDEWAKQGFLMDRVGSIIQVAPFNVIVTSHEEVVRMNDKSESIAPKMGSRNFSKNAAKYFDDVVYLDKVNNKLKMFSSATYKDNVVSGSRTGKLVEKEGSRGLVELFE